MSYRICLNENSLLWQGCEAQQKNKHKNRCPTLPEGATPTTWFRTMPINTLANPKYDQLQTLLSQQQQLKSSKGSVKVFI